MSPRKARALLRLERVGDVCPSLRAAYRDGRLSWVQAQVLAPLLVSDAEGEWRQAWVDHAGCVSVRRLEEQIDEALLLRETESDTWQRHREHPERFGGDLAREAANVCANTAWETGFGFTLSAPKDVVRFFRATLCTLRRALERETGRLPSEGEAFDAMLDHALTAGASTTPGSSGACARARGRSTGSSIATVGAARFRAAARARTCTRTTSSSARPAVATRSTTRRRSTP
jgi:hypothetical protein